MASNDHTNVDYHGIESPTSTHRTKADELLETKLNWSATKTMFGSLVAAVILAFGHHFFYLHFDHTQVDQSINQQWMSRIGTAFAFLVKTFAAVAAGIAYVQQQWLVLHSNPLKLANVDSMFGAMRDVSSFMDLGIWARNPVLALLALVPWLIPLAAIITPGTLSVHTIMYDNHTFAAIPQISFQGTNFAFLTALLGNWYDGPIDAVSRVSYASSVTRNILQIHPEHQNISYDTRFLGPGIECSHGDRSTMAAGIAYWTVYRSRVPQSSGSLDKTSSDSARIFVSSIPNILEDPLDALIASLSECRLGNYSYHVHFTFAYPLQSITVLESTRINNVNGLPGIDYIPPTNGDLGKYNTYFPIASYQAVMDAFGRILMGSGIAGSYVGIRWDTTLYPLTSIRNTTQEEICKDLETLFQNITLSLLSEPSLLQNSTQVSSIPVTISTSINVYAYQPTNLYLAYGIALGCALLCTLVGLHAMLQNQAGYSNKFSTIMRAACRVENCEFIDPGDRGSDPLPGSLANATVTLEK